MKTVVLTVEDVCQIVQNVGFHALMDQMIARLTLAFQQYTPEQNVIPTRAGFAYEAPDLGLVEWMPVMDAGMAVTIKVVGYHPANPSRRQLPTILSTVSRYDTASGHLVGLADATFITALRTGAASAVASQYLAHPDARIVGLIGAGAQAVTQLHALSRRFEIEQVLLYDTDPHVSESFCERIGFLNLPVREMKAGELDILVRQADILCTATSTNIGQEAVFADTETKPWLHINAVGADFPGKTEVPLSLLQRSTVCPDFLEQAAKEGECQRLIPHEIGASLYQIVQNPERYRPLQHSLTVFDSTGWALEDQVAMEILLDYAKALNVGHWLQLESVSADPHNPYGFVTAVSTSSPLTPVTAAI